MNHSTTLRHSKSHRAKVHEKRESLSRADVLRELGLRPHGTVEGDCCPLPRTGREKFEYFASL